MLQQENKNEINLIRKCQMPTKNILFDKILGTRFFGVPNFTCSNCFSVSSFTWLLLKLCYIYFKFKLFLCFQRILVLVAFDVDALCGCKILQVWWMNNCFLGWSKTKFPDWGWFDHNCTLSLSLTLLQTNESIYNWSDPSL